MSFLNKFLNKFIPNYNNWCFYLILFHKTSARIQNISRYIHWITKSSDELTWCDKPAADWPFCSWYTRSGKTTMKFSLCSRLQETRQIISVMAFKPYPQNHYHFPRPVGAQFHWRALKYFVWHNNFKTVHNFFKHNSIPYTSVRSMFIFIACVVGNFILRQK